MRGKYICAFFRTLAIFLLVTATHLRLSSQTVSIGGVINDYAAVTAMDTITCPVKIAVSTTVGFGVGDSILIIQMKGAEFDSSNTAAFGSINNLKGAGSYEIAKITAISSNTLFLNGKLTNIYYLAGKVQAVRIPQYVNANVTSVLTCGAWNGTVGGVLILTVQNNLQLSANINTDGKGFRGGTVSNNPDGGCGSGSPGYFYPLTQTGTFWTSGGAQKGEGIGTVSAAKQAGRGPLVNGGGGGNKHNTGGGGGSNFTTAGQGGNGLSGCNHTTDGLGGLTLATYYSTNKLFLGGGGGCGDHNNGQGTSGENGGGIIIITAGSISGNNHLISSGGNTVTGIAGSAIDGAGGGGGGGAVFINAASVSSFTTRVNGGGGGDQGGNCAGPGGGGGTGAILLNLSSLSGTGASFVPGAPGIHLTGTCGNYGATAAASNTTGALFSRHLVYTLPGAANLTLTATSSNTLLCAGNSATITAGGSTTYTWQPGNITTPSIVVSPNTTTIYTLTSGNSSDCTGSISVTQSVSPTPTVSAVVSPSIACNGNTATITASGATTYTWQPGALTGSAIAVTPLSTTVYTVKGAAAGCSATAMATVTVPTALTLTVSASSPSACVGNSITLTANAGGGTPGYTYTWAGGPSTNTAVLSPSTGGAYTRTVTVTDLYGCSLTKTISVNFAITVTLTASSISVCPNITNTLTVSGASTYTWNPASFVGSSYTVNTSVPQTHTVTGTSAAGCLSHPLTVSVSIKPLPALSFNTFSITCANLGSATVSASGGTGPFSYTWMPTAQTTSIANNLNPGTYTLSVFDNGTGCLSASTTTFTSLVPLTGTVSASNSVACSGINSATAGIALSNGSGSQSYTWTSAAGTLNTATVSALAAGINTVTVVDALTFCSVTQTFLVTQPPALTLSIVASSPSVCLGAGSITLTAGNSGGTPPYTYTWTNGTPNTTTVQVNEITAGVYTYTVNSTDANNCFSSKTVSITFVPNPTISVSNVSICPLATGTLTASGATTYTWNGASAGNPFTASPNATAEYTVVGTALSCTAAATASIILKPVPAVTATVADDFICNGQALSFSAAGTGTAYAWSGPPAFSSAQQNPVINVAAPPGSGTYTVKTTGANSCTNAAVVSVTVNPTPTVSVVGSTVCAGQTLSLSAGFLSGATYSWSGAGFVSSVRNPTIGNSTPLMTGPYTLTVTSAAGCTNTAVANASVTPLPNPSISSNSPRCKGSTLTFSASGGVSYVWQGPNGFSSIAQNTLIANAPLQASGTYTLISTTGPCVITVTAAQVVNPLPTPTITANSTVCAGSDILLGGSGGLIYSWAGPLGFTSGQQNTSVNAVTLLNSGAYSLTVTDANNCQATVSKTIVVLPNPVPAVSGGTACAGQAATLHVQGGVTYLWSGPGGFFSTLADPVIPVVDNSTAGTYSVVVTGTNGCGVTATVAVSGLVLPLPTPTITAAPKACINSRINLSASGGYLYQWNGPAGFVSSLQEVSLPVVSTSAGGVYTLNVKNTSNCTGSATVMIRVYPQPNASLISTANDLCVPFCSDLKTTGLGNMAPIVRFNYQVNGKIFSDSSVLSTATSAVLKYCFLNEGIYNIQVNYTDTNTCSNTATLSLHAHERPDAGFEFFPPHPVAGLDEVVFTNTSVGDEQSSWSWFFTKNLPDTSNRERITRMFKETGAYPVVLLVENKWGCADTIIKIVQVDDEFTFYVPAAFTPNGDGLNDTFQPKGIAIISYRLNIYNRWGERIYTTDDFYAGWDGTFKGNDCTDDVYAWKIDVVTSFKVAKTFTGTVTLIR